MTSHQGLVDELRAAASRKTEHKRLVLRRHERFDATWFQCKDANILFLGVGEQHTDDIVGNIFRHIPGIFSNDDPPGTGTRVSVIHCLDSLF